MAAALTFRSLCIGGLRAARCRAEQVSCLLKQSADGVAAHPLRQWAVYYCRRPWACEAKYLRWL